MANLFQRLKNLFSGKEPEPALSVEELRAVFKARYYAFKQLLAANNTALQLMTDMEAALRGKHGFGMTFVRSHATAVCVNVFTIIKYLNELTGNRYQALEKVFADIEGKIGAILTQRQPPAIGELVLPLQDVRQEMADGVGSKMANLGEITGELPEIAVPPGFAITAAAFELFLAHNQLTDEINRRLQSMEEEEMADLYRKSADIQKLIINAELPPELAEAITGKYAALERTAGAAVKVALRSSAIGEDAAETSFAGQYHSELNVSRDNILAVYKEVLASKYALTAVSYRLHKGLRDEDVAMCVGCMAMVDSVCGGVMYSRDPTDMRSDAILINGVHGLAKAVVDGTVTPDLWVIARGEPLTILRREIRDKGQKVVCLPEEGVRLLSDAGGAEPALTDEQALELARMALRLEEHFQAPQDIEWCIDGAGKILILQSRPLRQMAAPRGESVEAGKYPVALRGGELAGPGVAAGPVYVVQNNLDLLQFPEGAVLVTAFPHPGWAPLLNRAAALVTDRGGITGHLANVAREFGIPALFNTLEATTRLTPGQVVTVDADGLMVYEGRVEELLVLAGPREGLMAGTPVGETLKEVMTLITPLHLTDPGAREFSPKGCRTLHDITRFAHEISVKEMFAFDKKQAFSRYFIKKLVTPVASGVVGPEPGRRVQGGGAGDPGGAEQHRLRPHAGPVGGDHRRGLGRAAAGGHQGVHVHRYGRGHGPQPGHGRGHHVRQYQLFHDRPGFLQPDLPAGVSLFHGGGPGGGSGLRELHPVCVQGRGRGLSAPGQADQVRGGDPGALPLQGGREGRRPVRPAGGGGQGLSLLPAAGPGLPDDPHPPAGHDHA